MTPQAQKLSENLALPLGRGTFLEAQAQRQLTGSAGTLSTQLCELLDAALTALRALLAVQADLPPRRPHSWTVLSEFEHPAWPMLALSRPPALPVADTARLVRHLSTAHLAMEISRARRWAQDTAQRESQREGTEALLNRLTGPQDITWAALITAISTVQTQHVMLHSWGVLSAYVGLNTDLRLQAAEALLTALKQNPALCENPAEFGAELLWAALTLLHGGLPRPSTAEISRLAHAMRTLPERTVNEILPEPPALNNRLLELLPALSQAKRHELADRLSGLLPTDPNLMTTGLLALSQPGQTAFWLRRAAEVQLIICRAEQGSPLTVRAWRWHLPRKNGT